MGAMRPQTPHRSPRQALGGIHKVPAYGGIIKIAPDTLFSLPDYMPVIRGQNFRFPLPLYAPAALRECVYGSRF